MAKIPKQKVVPKPLRVNKFEQEIIDIEIEKNLWKGIVELVDSTDDDEFISNIFIRPKKDGRVRIILALMYIVYLFRLIKKTLI